MYRGTTRSYRNAMLYVKPMVCGVNCNKLTENNLNFATGRNDVKIGLIPCTWK